MKKAISILLLFGLFAVIAVPVQAQKNDKKAAKEAKKKEKAEKKLWKKKAKGYSKEPFSLRDDLESANNKLKDCSVKNKDLLDQLANMRSVNDSLRAAANSRLNELAALNSKYEKLQAAYEAQKNINEKNIIPGLVYKVQIGAFVHFDINQYLKDTENFEGESKDGMNKYTIGNFRELNIAEAFKLDVRKMGIKDAWIVPFIDGKRVTMEEARQYISRQGN